MMAEKPNRITSAALPNGQQRESISKGEQRGAVERGKRLVNARQASCGKPCALKWEIATSRSIAPGSSLTRKRPVRYSNAIRRFP